MHKAGLRDSKEASVDGEELGDKCEELTPEVSVLADSGALRT